jgi:hypothetical protein
MTKTAKSIRILAGTTALKQMRQQGLKPDDIQVVTAAAGGPKWLALSHLDRFLFTEWFKGRVEPLHLLGASAGAWRLAAAATANPLAAIERFEDLYIDQQYSLKPTAAQVTTKSSEILAGYLGASGVREILNHPSYRLNILVNRCRGPLSTEQSQVLKFSIGAVGLSSILHRKLLHTFIDRFVGSDRRTELPLFTEKKDQVYSLVEDNMISSLLASGSIPVVMSGVRDVAGAGTGVFRDGGLIDYHVDLPFDLPHGKLILCPHFIPKIIPGWFDRFAPWRPAKHIDKTVLVVPSESFIKTLPNEKIPCRKDFFTYAGRDATRKKNWQSSVAACKELADEFAEVLASGNIGSVAEPI